MIKVLCVAILSAAMIVSCGPMPDDSGSVQQEAKTSRKPKPDAGTTPVDAGTPDAGEPPQVTAFTLSTTSTRSTTPTWATSFPVSSTADVFIAATITGPYSGSHTARIVVRMPSGSLYQTFDIKFATDNLAGTGEVQAEPILNGYRVWADLMVAGTMIESQNITGNWTLSLHMDGAAEAASAMILVLY